MPEQNMDQYSRPSAVASQKEAERHQQRARGHRGGCGRDLPSRCGRGDPEFYISNAKFCILVHSWLRKWAPATLKNLAK